jgi:aminoglycoside phosphotransferase family enzyme
MNRNQDQMIAFSGNAESYLDVGYVDRIDFGCVAVFLIEDRTYKLKRAAGFLHPAFTLARTFLVMSANPT